MKTDLNIINSPMVVNRKENPINPTLNEKSIEEKEFGIGATINNNCKDHRYRTTTFKLFRWWFCIYGLRGRHNPISQGKSTVKL